MDNLIMALDENGKDVSGAAEIWRQTIPYHRNILTAMIENKPFQAEEAHRIIHQLDRQVIDLQKVCKKGR